MILVDTSAWVEFDRASGSRIDEQLTHLISTGADIGVTEPVLMEMLAGARSEQANASIRHLLTSFGWIPADAQTDFEAASRVYALCRRSGVTPRGLIDCMIAAIALRSDSSILAVDGDFDRIASVVPVRIHPPTG